MSIITRGVPPRPCLPGATVITVLIVVAAVLVLRGVAPADALALTGGAGLVGAVVVRISQDGALTAVLRPLAAVLQAPSSA
ncbi:hypothetical protein ACGF8B_39110 [Streptomyces sp. NPDC047917]|uniref:hypothetical protein n=1 Tax=Streptomyces sp. NPDC047917 TaxID=3365491 RepID=UPI0037113605